MNKMMNRIIKMIKGKNMNKLFLILCLFLIGCNNKPVENSKINEISSDDSKIVSCIDCNGSGVFLFKKGDPMVDEFGVPEGTTEVCQSCKGLGKLKKCIRPNGMIYYMSL